MPLLRADVLGISIERTLHGNRSRMRLRIDAAAPSERQVAYSQSGGRAERNGKRSHGKSLPRAVLASVVLQEFMVHDATDGAPRSLL